MLLTTRTTALHSKASVVYTNLRWPVQIGYIAPTRRFSDWARARARVSDTLNRLVGVV